MMFHNILLGGVPTHLTGSAKGKDGQIWRAIGTGIPKSNDSVPLLDDLIMTNTTNKTTSNAPLNQFPGDPNILLDALIEKLHLKNDAALSRLLEVAPPVISKLRHGALPIGPTMLIRMHEVSELGIREMRALMLKGAEHAD
jgi:hypothetical protein